MPHLLCSDYPPEKISFEEKAIKHLLQLQPCFQLSTGGRSKGILSPYLTVKVSAYYFFYCSSVFTLRRARLRHDLFKGTASSCRMRMFTLNCHSPDPACMHPVYIWSTDHNFMFLVTFVFSQRLFLLNITLSFFFQSNFVVGTVG